MRIRTTLLVVTSVIFFSKGFCQKPDTLVHKLDSLNKKTDTTGEQKNVINPKAYTENTTITFPTYFILLGSDLKQQITAPFHQTGKEWLRIGAFIGGTAILSSID